MEPTIPHRLRLRLRVAAPSCDSEEDTMGVARAGFVCFGEVNTPREVIARKVGRGAAAPGGGRDRAGGHRTGQRRSGRGRRRAGGHGPLPGRLRPSHPLRGGLDPQSRRGERPHALPPQAASPVGPRRVGGARPAGHHRGPGRHLGAPQAHGGHGSPVPLLLRNVRQAGEHGPDRLATRVPAGPRGCSRGRASARWGTGT